MVRVMRRTGLIISVHTDGISKLANQVDTGKNESGFSETVKVILQALVLAVVVRTFLFQPFTIPSGSMMPNLLVGDYLFVSKYSYGFSRYSFPFSPDIFSGRIWEGEPKRGQVVVFKFPPNPELDYIKRLVGLPGDKIQVTNGVLSINGTPVKREAHGTWTPENGGPAIPVYRETLPEGVTYDTLDVNPNSEGDNTQVFEVPPGTIFLHGRQPRQLARQPLRRWLRAVRKPRRSRAGHLLLGQERRASACRSGAGHRTCVQRGC